jgi:hypothetical protein
MTDAPSAHETSLTTTLAPSRPAASKVRKFVNRRHRGDVFRDARFARDRLRALLPAQDGAQADASVIDVITAADALVASLAALTPQPITPKRTPQHYSSIFVGPSLRKDPRTGAPRVVNHRTPSPWQDITEGELLDWLYAGADALGTLCDYSLNFNPDIIAKALAQPSALDYARRRVAHHLKREFGRAIPFVTVIEETADGRPHLHGVLVLPTDQRTRARARRALRKAGGGGMPKMAQVRPDPNAHWMAYVGKDVRLARPGLRALRGQTRVLRSLNYQGKAISYTQDVGRKAKRLYEAWRDDFVKARKLASQQDRKPEIKKHRKLSSSYILLLTGAANGLRQCASHIGDQPQCMRMTPTSRMKSTPGLSRPLWSPLASSVPARAACRPTRSRSRSARRAAYGRRASSPTWCASTSIISGAPTPPRDSGKPVGGRFGLVGYLPPAGWKRALASP